MEERQECVLGRVGWRGDLSMLPGVAGINE